MNSYIHLNPTYELIDQKFKEKDGKVIECKQIFKVTLNTGEELVLKYMRFDSKKVQIARALDREYEVGELPSLLTDGVPKSLKIQERVEGSDTIVGILMEYTGESLQKIIKNKELKHGDSFKITLQLLNTLTLMEKIGISHLNIKLLNITWNRKTDKVKLIDFGTSVLFYGSTNRLKENVSSKEVTGYTKAYAAPEIEKEVNLQKLDVYSFGVTFVKLLISEYGIENPISYNKNGYVNNIDVDLIDEQLPALKGVKELISDMICAVPGLRYTFNELRLRFLQFLEEMGNPRIVKEVKDITLDALLYLESYRTAGSDNILVLNGYNKKELMWAYFRLGLIFGELKNSRVSIECFKRGLESYSYARKGNKIVIDIYNYLSLLYFDINDYNKAIDYCNKALNIILKVHGKEHADIADWYNNLGIIYERMDENKRALDFHNAALDIKKKIYVEQHSEIAISYYYLGGIYNRLNNYKKAIEYFNEVLDIYLKIDEKQSLYMVATTYINLGSIYVELCDYNKAKDYLYKGLNITQKTLGEQHLSTVNLYTCLGILHDNIGDYEEAKDYYNKALNIALNINGEQDLNVGSLYNNLGLTYCKVEDYKTAKEYYEKALNIIEHKKEPSLLAGIYNNIGAIYYKMGDKEKAKDYYNKALDILLNIDQEHHPDVAVLYNNLSNIYHDIKDSKTAFDYCNKALNICLQIDGERDTITAEVYLYLVMICNSLDDLENAKNYCTRALQLNEELNEKDDRKTIKVTNIQVINILNHIYKRITLNKTISSNIAL